MAVKLIKLSSDVFNLQTIIPSLYMLEPEGKLVFESPQNTLNLRVKNKRSESLTSSLDQDHIEITKKAGKEDYDYSIEFQQERESPHLEHPRHILEVIGKKTGWMVEKFKPFNDRDLSYFALSLPLQNFGRQGKLYIYNGWKESQ